MQAARLPARGSKAGRDGGGAAEDSTRAQMRLSYSLWPGCSLVEEATLCRRAVRRAACDASTKGYGSETPAPVSGTASAAAVRFTCLHLPFSLTTLSPTTTTLTQSSDFAFHQYYLFHHHSSSFLRQGSSSLTFSGSLVLSFPFRTS